MTQHADNRDHSIRNYADITSYLGVEDEICPYATFHLLGFREEMDPSKALNFQTFPNMPNGQHIGTMGPNGPMPHPAHMHSRAGSQSMVFESETISVFRNKFNCSTASSKSFRSQEQPRWSKLNLLSCPRIR